MNYFTQYPKEGCGYIYKYTNKIDGKSYIGQTIRSLKARMGSNYNGYKKCTAFYRALNKYGLENFDIEILCEVEIALLDKKEQEYIEKYNSLTPNGYNICDGRDDKYFERNSNKTKIYQYDTEGNFLQSYDSLASAAKELNISYQAISAVLREERKQTNGWIFTYELQEVQPVQVKKTHGRKTAQYDLDGNLIAIFNSANEAAIAIGKNSNAGRNIRSVCYGDRITAYGYKWKFLD